MPKGEHTVGADWFDQDNDDRLSDEELLANAAAEAEAWQQQLAEERERENWKRGAHR